MHLVICHISANIVSRLNTNISRLSTVSASRTCRFEETNAWFVSDCRKMAYPCQLTSYDAGRAPGEAQKSARRARRLRAWGPVDLIAGAEGQAELCCGFGANSYDGSQFSQGVIIWNCINAPFSLGAGYPLWILSNHSIEFGSHSRYLPNQFG